jgi:hypothetical protein
MSKKYPKSLTDPNFDLNAYRKDLVKTLVSEHFKILEGERKAYGEQFAEEVMFSVIASMISSAVYKSLNSLKVAANAGNEEGAMDIYLNCKREIENAVAAGFTGAHTAFNPDVHPDYQVDIVCLDDGSDLDGIPN